MIDIKRDPRLNRGTTQGQMSFWDATLGKWTYTETSEMFWDDVNKRVGIGKIPTATLDVAGTMNFNDVTGNVEFFANETIDNASNGNSIIVTRKSAEGTDSFNILVGDNRNGEFSADRGMFFEAKNSFLYFKSNTDIFFNIGENDDMFIRDHSSVKLVTIQESTGNVGIGTDSPDSQVHVQGNATDGVLHLSSSTDANGGMYLTGTSDNIGVISAGAYYDRDAGAWRATSTQACNFNFKDGEFYISEDNGLTDGNTFTPTKVLNLITSVAGDTKLGLGLGATDPNYHLHIKAATGNAFMTFYTQDTTAIAGIALGDSAKQYEGMIQYDNNTDKMGFFAKATRVLTIDGINERVGIGTDSPTEKAQVSGNIFLTTDSDKLLFGTLKDVEQYYNGTDFIIDTGAIAPSDLIVDCGTEKTLELAEVVYKDTNLGAAQLSKPASSQPDTDSFVDEAGADTGIETLAFAPGEKVHGSFEIQHDYKEGTDIEFHVHWQGITAPTGTDKVKWQLTYTCGASGQTLDAPTTIVIETDFDTQYEFKLSEFVAITGTNISMGEQFLFTIERITASADEYAGDPLLATVGIHYQIDTIGSRQKLTK